MGNGHVRYGASGNFHAQSYLAMLLGDAAPRMPRASDSKHDYGI
jgi:hypothetical protein